MPVIQSNGCPIHVEVEGLDTAPALMLCNSLGCDLHMWDPQVAAFAKQFRLIRYDRRGHGKSGVTTGDYSMEMLARDALAVMDGLGVAKVNWCGLSMGGMVGQWLGANAGNRIDRLILSNTACYYASKDFWNERIALIRAKGLAHIVGANMERWFTTEFRNSAPQVIAKMADMFVATPLDGYLGCCAAVRDMDHRDLLPKISAPTLIIAGRFDQATPLENSEYIRAHIPGAAMTILDAAHISNLAQPEQFTREVLGFLTGKRGGA